MTQTQPDAPLSKQDIIDAIAAAGTTSTGIIGMGPNQKPVGERPQHTTTGGVMVSQFGTSLQASPYKTGDELNPGTGSQDQVLRTQNQLIQAGLLSPTGVRPGFWDAKSAAAYKIVLAYANQHAMTATDAMAQFLDNPANQTQGRQAPFQFTNPMQVAQAVSGGGPGQTNVAQSLTGKNLSPSETKDFTDWYAQQEAKARDDYQQADLTAGGTATSAPDVTAAAQQYIKEHNLSDTVAYGTASRMLQFFDLLKGVV